MLTATHPFYGFEIGYEESDRYVGGEIARAQFELAESQVFWTLLAPDTALLDIGANIGYYSLLAGMKIDPKRGRGLAFEPEERAFALLAGNLKRNRFDAIKPMNVALGAEDAAVTLYVNPQNTGDHRVWGAGDISAAETQTVRICRGDDIVGDGRVSLIKMDVQGHELAALSGLERTISGARDLALLMEFSPAMNQAAGVDNAELWRWIAGHFSRIHRIQPDDWTLRRTDLGEVLHIAARTEHVNLLATKGQGGAPLQITR